MVDDCSLQSVTINRNINVSLRLDICADQAAMREAEWFNFSPYSRLTQYVLIEQSRPILFHPPQSTKKHPLPHIPSLVYPFWMSNPQPPPQKPASTQRRSQTVMSQNTDMLFQASTTLGREAAERQMQQELLRNEAMIWEGVVQAREEEVTDDAGWARKEAVKPDGLEYVAKVKGTSDEAQTEWAKVILWLREKLPWVSGDIGTL